MNTTKIECLQIGKKIQRALNGKSRDFFLSLDPVLKKPFAQKDRNYFFSFRGIEFYIMFDEYGYNAKINNICHYTDRNGYRRDVDIPARTEHCYPVWSCTLYGKGKYTYSLDTLASMFSIEPFVLQHLTETDLEWYAHAVTTEMEEWDDWLKDGTVSKEKHDDYLCSVEERILTNIAPYWSDIKTMDEYMDLFLKTNES